MCVCVTLQLSYQDPVRVYNLRDYVLERLNILKQHSPEGLDSLMGQVDIDVYNQLQHFLQ